MAQIYVPDTLEFDFTGILGTIGSGIVSAGSYLAKNLLTSQNISTVVGAVVQKQMAKSQPSASPSVFPMPISTGASLYGGQAAPVQSQPVIISGGGGGGPYPISAPAASPFGAINPLYIIAGMGILALAMTRR